MKKESNPESCREIHGLVLCLLPDRSVGPSGLELAHLLHCLFPLQPSQQPEVTSLRVVCSAAIFLVLFKQLFLAGISIPGIDKCSIMESESVITRAGAQLAGPGGKIWGP